MSKEIRWKRKTKAPVLRKLVTVATQLAIPQRERSKNILSSADSAAAHHILNNKKKLINLKDVVKNKKSELKKILELEYGFLDQLVSQGYFDLEQVKVIEDTESSTLQRKNIVKEMAVKFMSNATDRKKIFDLLKKHNQNHVAAFIEQEGCLSDSEEVKCWPLDTVRKSKISRNMRVLVENIDPDNGLVREWGSKGCINHQQCRDIEQTSPQFKRNRKLLNFLLQQSIANYDVFVDSLKVCGQGNRAELLEISKEQEDEKTEVTSGTASRNWMKELIHLIDFNHGLLDDMISCGLHEYKYRVEDLKAKSSSFDQRGRLLDLMVKRSSTGILQFLEALRTTGQEHVANFITRNGCRYTSDDELFKRWPLDSQYETRITRNFHQLSELIVTDADFVHSLNINSLQKCDVDETRDEYDKSRKLLDFLLQSSIANYEDFVECLKKTNQRLVAKILEDDVVVEVFESTISSRDAIKQEIVDRWKEVRSNYYSQTFCTINEKLYEGVGPGVEIVDIQPGSVRCYLLCRTPTALKALYEKLENGSLNVTMEYIFNLLLGGEDTVHLEQTKGRLSASKLQRRVEIFSKDLDSVITPVLTVKDGANGESRDLIAELLEQPEDMWSTYDVLEPILLQVAVKLFKVNRLRLLLPRPGVTTLITVNSVCPVWWEVIKGRKIIRRKLKLSFRKLTVLPLELFKAAVLQRHRLVDVPHKTSRDADVIVLRNLASVCRRWKAAFSESGDLRRRQLKLRFHHYPQLLFALNEPPKYIFGNRRVTGVVMLENVLYVIYEAYNKIEVFDCEGRCKKIKDIEISNVTQPVDMVGSSVTSQLFIIDWDNDVIWRVDSKTQVSYVFKKTGYKDMGLSLVENRLLVTSPVSLLIFDIVSGERMKEIPLTKYNVLHAIESNRDSFFVIHGPSDNSTVSEIDSEGRVIRVLDNKQQLYFDRLALDSVGRLLVADQKNRQVVLFDEHLKSEKVLIDSKQFDYRTRWTLSDGRPLGLHYCKNNNRLTVGLDDGQVKIFEY